MIKHDVHLGSMTRRKGPVRQGRSGRQGRAVYGKVSWRNNVEKSPQACKALCQLAVATDRKNFWTISKRKEARAFYHLFSFAASLAAMDCLNWFTEVSNVPAKQASI